MTKAEIKKIRPMVERIVEDKLREILGDPESGLGLNENIRERLRRSLLSKAEGVPVQRVAKNLGLNW